MNLFGTMERMCFALGVARLDDIGARVTEILEPEIPTNFLEKLKMLPRLARLADFLPKTVSSAPCQELVERERPSLSFLPVVKTWPGDGGPFITLPLVFTKDPETGRRNVGMYRMHVYDETTTGMHWHVHKAGRSTTAASAGSGSGCPSRWRWAATPRRSIRPPHRCPRMSTR
jgi:4-hydroxy-3-polyprenylbenzoate decarboxylase